MKHSLEIPATLEPAVPCVACGSGAGTVLGCCVVCACPSEERQLNMSRQNGKKFLAFARTVWGKVPVSESESDNA